MEAHTVKDAVQQMSVLMANLYYYLTREFVETYGLLPSVTHAEKQLLIQF